MQNGEVPNFRYKRIIFLLFFIFLFLPTSTPVYASNNDTGGTGGGGASSGVSGEPKYDCTGKSTGKNGPKSYGAYGRCNRWIIATKDQFRDAWQQAEPSSANYTHYDICTGSKNPVDIVIFAGHTSPKGKSGLMLWNMDPLPSEWNGHNYKILKRDWEYDARNDSTGNKESTVVTNDGRTLAQLRASVLSNLRTSEAKLAFFCQGMEDSKEDEPTTTTTNIVTEIETTVNNNPDPKEPNVSETTEDGYVEFEVGSANTSLPPSSPANDTTFTSTTWTGFGASLLLNLVNCTQYTYPFDVTNITINFTPPTISSTAVGDPSPNAPFNSTAGRQYKFYNNQPQYLNTNSNPEPVSKFIPYGADRFILKAYSPSKQIDYYTYQKEKTGEMEVLGVPVDLYDYKDFHHIGDPRTGGVKFGCALVYHEALAEIRARSVVSSSSPSTDPVGPDGLKKGDSGYTEEDAFKLGELDTNNTGQKIFFAPSKENDDANEDGAIELTFEGYTKRPDNLNNYLHKDVDPATISIRSLFLTQNVNMNYYTNNGENSPASTQLIKEWPRSASLSSPDNTDVKVGQDTIKVGNKSGGETQIARGTYNKEVCLQTITTNRKIIKWDSYDDVSLSATATAEACAHLYRPWNYDLSIDSIVIDNMHGGVFLNGSATAPSATPSVTVSVKNQTNSDSAQEGNASYSPETTVKIYKVIVNSASDIENLHNVLSSYRNTPRSTTITSTEIGQTPVDVGHDTVSFDPNAPGAQPVTISTNATGSDGQKVCFFAEINHTNSTTDTTGPGFSHTFYNADDGTGPKNSYTYSDPACATFTGLPIAKIYGGSLYSEGTIRTRVFNDPSLGSWVDYGIVGKSDIYGLSSGKATIGEYDCRHHPLTINNDVCRSFRKTTDPADPEKVEQIDPAYYTIKKINADGTYPDAYDSSKVSPSSIGHNNTGSISPTTKADMLRKYSSAENEGLEPAKLTTDKNEHSETTLTYSAGGAIISSKEYYCLKDSSFTILKDCNTDDLSSPGKYENTFRYTQAGSESAPINNVKLSQTNPLYPLSAGTTHVIEVYGNITIISDLKYGYMNADNRYRKLDQIPQYIIIARKDNLGNGGNINIEQNVAEVNAWLIADGTINTCTDDNGNNNPTGTDGQRLRNINPITGNWDGSYNTKACSSTLSINGPTFANKIELNRTAADSAEVFDINPLSYYWSYYQAKQNGQMSTVYYTSLPPRY